MSRATSMLIIVHSFVHVEGDPIPFPFPIIHIDVPTAPTVEKDDTCLWVASGVCWKKIPPPPLWGKSKHQISHGSSQILVAAASRPKVVIRKN